ncbi:acetyl-CoA synthetase-like protein [Penicillium verhagenii]|uniref:acetyl-CoA synthetase-like protein n=1 Tax=Penicillium verhagenii TaxID=1562060 RepID=UPI002545717E|nr:acetyl-CoA synthetase-like protein [Penicillium verhagenii]KAJ5930540.1 acetyl-CoA synthetase-like protein [Penicillium verhagenii]
MGEFISCNSDASNTMTKNNMNVFGTLTDSDNEPLLGGECGKRLMPQIIDATAIATPDVACMFVPRTLGNPRDGWKPVSWAQVASAVNYVAHMLVEQVGTPIPGDFPTIAFMGLEDPRYVIFLMGAIKAGYKALFISPRNSVEAQVHLFNKTDCDNLYYDQSLASMVAPWVAGRAGMKSFAIAPLDEWVAAEVAPFPYTKSFAEAEWEPFVVLHTSGSTGLPKPVIISHGKLALNDLHRYVPEYEGNLPWLPTWGKFDNPRYLITCPLFHTAGIAPTVLSGFYYNTPLIFRDPSVPLTGDNVVEWLQNSGATYTVLPPAILEQMSRSQVALDEMKKLQVVAFGGGPIAPAAAAALLSNNVKLVNAIGATELIYMPYYTQPDSSLWAWFIIPTEMLGIEWRPFGEDTYEQVFIRQNKGHPGNQTCFYVFPELDEYSTNDLYRPHPTLPNHWTYVGRADDIIVFSTGEKLNPTTIEGAVIGHPAVLGAQVMGSGQFHAALIIEPAKYPANEQEKQRFLDDVWPVIEKVNEQTVAHGRILRDYVFLSDPERPFPRAGKGTIQRAMASKLYVDDIRRIFESSSDTNGVSATAVQLDFSSEATLTDGIRELVRETVKLPALGVDDDFFTVGVDSLQVLQLARVLSASVKKTIEARNIYSNPTIAQLSSFINSLAGSSENGDAVTSEADALVLQCSALVEKYTQNLPAPTSTKPLPATTNQTIIITGTTGAVGCYLLDLALANPEITKIYCFNRTSDARERQIAASSFRGLSTDFPSSRVEFLTVDLSSSSKFNLSEEITTRLAGTVDLIIHNAWPVDFNQSIASFEPHLRGVRHLIDFSAAAAKRIPITFVSSVSTVEQWPESTPIPEQSLSDFSQASQMGYGQSKLAASLILDAGANQSSVPRNVVRVGQVAGPRAEQGQWNPREWLPSIIRSSLFLGLLPSNLGLLANMGWAPVEDIAGVILEVAAGQNGDGGYFHAINPNLPDWEGVIVPAVTEFYGSRIERVVGFEEWVDALEKSAVGDVDLEKNPGVKLLDTYRLASTKVTGDEDVGAGFATEKTEQASETMRRMEPVTAELMKRWCKQWQF